MNFANVRNGNIIDFNCNYIDSDIERIYTDDLIYNAYLEDKLKVIFKDNEIILNPDYEEIKKQKERNKLDMLSLTAADVERAIYQLKGMDFEDIVNYLKENPIEGLDLKALKIELKANNFYRGNPYINKIGKILGISQDELDYLFKNGKF